MADKLWRNTKELRDAANSHGKVKEDMVAEKVAAIVTVLNCGGTKRAKSFEDDRAIGHRLSILLKLHAL